MPSFSFDITDRAVEAAKDVMSAMPGNPGQETLVNDLYIDAYAAVRVDIDGPLVRTSTSYDIDIQSAHPEAIYIIIEAGKQAFEEYAKGAGDTEGLVDFAFGLL